VYYEEVRITGGTGKFDGASGRTITHGSADFVNGHTVFRYRGEITLKAATAAPTVGASALHDGQFRFQVSAPVGRLVTAEVSENLKQSDVLVTQANAHGTVEFRDRAAAGSPQRFYRARRVRGTQAPQGQPRAPSGSSRQQPGLFESASRRPALAASSAGTGRSPTAIRRACLSS
jgi:hypothetical protein